VALGQHPKGSRSSHPLGVSSISASTPRCRLSDDPRMPVTAFNNLVRVPCCLFPRLAGLTYMGVMMCGHRRGGVMGVTELSLVAVRSLIGAADCRPGPTPGPAISAPNAHHNSGGQQPAAFQNGTADPLPGGPAASGYSAGQNLSAPPSESRSLSLILWVWESNCPRKPLAGLFVRRLLPNVHRDIDRRIDCIHADRP
jgi:hypothetical protein